MSQHSKHLLGCLPDRPRSSALSLTPRTLQVSAHWEEARVTVQTAPKPPMLFDYYGFPDQCYQYRYDAPGAPQLARKATELLRAAGVPTAEDDQRGLDHGAFVPLMLMFPHAQLPVFQVREPQVVPATACSTATYAPNCILKKRS